MRRRRKGEFVTGTDVIEILDALQQERIDVWLDGGWAVDALVGRQTREHDDLDVVVALDDVELIKQALGKRGFAVAEDELPTRFVLKDSTGRQINFHTVIFDEEGGGIQKLQSGNTYRYHPKGFTATGIVEGREVKCLTARTQAECHYGYQPDEKDIHDMRLLSEHFKIKLYPPYT
jgi:lincosamide nucleotidyltransferase A/C/D/E